MLRAAALVLLLAAGAQCYDCPRISDILDLAPCANSSATIGDRLHNAFLRNTKLLLQKFLAGNLSASAFRDVGLSFLAAWQIAHDGESFAKTQATFARSGVFIRTPALRVANWNLCGGPDVAYKGAFILDNFREEYAGLRAFALPHLAGICEVGEAKQIIVFCRAFLDGVKSLGAEERKSFRRARRFVRWSLAAANG